MFGKCDVCGQENHLMRSTFNYDIKCECHSPNHFEISNHCLACVPVPPFETKIILKTENLNPLFEKAPSEPFVLGVHGPMNPGNGLTCFAINMENGEIICACLAPNAACGMYMLGFIEFEETMRLYKQSIEPFGIDNLNEMRGKATGMINGRFPDGYKKVWHGAYFGQTPIPADVLKKLREQHEIG